VPIHFTDLTVRNLKEGVYFDDSTPSFGIRIGKTRKTWLVLKGTNRTKVRLGFYPALGLAEARRKALVALGSPHHPIPSPAFPVALEEFLAQDRWKPRTKYEITRSLRRHFKWTKPLDKITHRDILAVIDNIKAKSEAAHALKDIKTFFSYCVPRYLPQSPCNGLSVPRSYTPRFRVLSDDEISRVWRAASDMGAYGVQVKLLITTGQRANQIISLKQEWIDYDKKLVRFPGSVMKGNREHVIPFGDLTAPLLKAHEPSSYQGKKKKLLDQRSKTSQWVLHDLRRYYSSTQRKLKTPIDITEAILSHISGSRSEIQRIYDLYDRIDDMREAVYLFEKHLQSIVR
jgi:integrase